MSEIEDQIESSDENLMNIEENQIIESSSSQNTDIKKPVNSYILFVMEHRDRVTKENPNASFREIPKILGELFRSLSPAERQRYDDLVKADKERYLKELSERNLEPVKTGINIHDRNSLLLPLVSLFIHTYITRHHTFTSL